MREAIGGSYIIYIAIILIMTYVFFVGFVMNYASAYRAANYVITQIENCQGQMDACGDAMTMKNITKTVKQKYGYATTAHEPNQKDLIIPTCFKNGSGVIYRVTLPVEFDLPLLGGIRWTSVKAETKTLQKDKC